MASNSLPLGKYGRLELIIGPMFAGKTSELSRRLNRYKLSNYKCLVVKYASDVRYAEDELVTHDGKRMTAVKCHNLYECDIDPSEYGVIGVDEGQFFSDIVPFCKDYLKKGKIIIVAGLDGTYLRTGFESILALVPLAINVKKLSAICMSCGKIAFFSKRITTEDQIELIGGVDKYMAVCRECYQIPVPEKRTPFKSPGPPNFSAVSKIDLSPPCKRRILTDGSS